ncbi:putative oxidoreductase [Abditibacterium utsteinense]|uniref:Putative oxidoreductase n=1 Tax=Abditibacterium utsteinense TaxID=1960156 RepID=A0A2S8SRU3_9BACT|nr:aldo/keto reductase [Abditibacterium utsteinense]PQV63498.1 putative oxidoreductase [Abditibacterium utsteinense]
MNNKSLGRTGAQVSPLCLGCMNFADGTNETDSIAIMHRALDAGIFFWDTADVYAGTKSEEVVGKALQGRRDEVFLATKVHGKVGERPNDQGNSRAHIIKGCEDSLRRLSVDYLDLYQIHRPQSSVPIDETLRALDDLVKSGKVRYIGTSTFAAYQLVESLWESEKLGLNRFVCEQPPYNLLDRRIERELLPFCAKYGFGVIPWSPLAGGMLTGKYRRDGENPAGSRYQSGKFRAGQEVSDATWNVIEGVRQIAQEKNVAMDAFALSWVMAQKTVTSPIIGPRTMEQLEGNLKALEVEISAEDNQRIDALIAPGTHVAEYYQADFGAK